MLAANFIVISTFYSIVFLLIVLCFWYFKNKSPIYIISFVSVSSGIFSILLAIGSSHLHWGPGLMLIICGATMVLLPLAVLLFHYLQKDNLKKMVKEEISKELTQMQAKDL